jgi:hypothetical protein
MKANFLLALSSLALISCAQKPIQLTEVKYDDVKFAYVPFDYIGDKSDGRLPAQSGGTALVKFVEGLGEGGSEKTLEWINGPGKKSLGLSKNVSKIDDLTASQRISVLEEFTRSGSALRAMFSHIPDVGKTAEGFMAQTSSYVTKAKLNTNLKGIPGAELPHTGMGPAVDIALYGVKKSSPKLGTEMTVFAKSLKTAGKNRPALTNYADDLIHSDVVFTKATGERLLSNKLCNTGSVEFSEGVMPTITEFTTGMADDAERMLQKNGGKLADEDVAGLAVRKHKQTVTGSTCLRSFQAVKSLSGGNGGACPLFSAEGKIARGIAKINDLSVHCK